MGPPHLFSALDSGLAAASYLAEPADEGEPAQAGQCLPEDDELLDGRLPDASYQALRQCQEACCTSAQAASQEPSGSQCSTDVGVSRALLGMECPSAGVQTSAGSGRRSTGEVSTSGVPAASVLTGPHLPSLAPAGEFQTSDCASPLADVRYCISIAALPEISTLCCSSAWTTAEWKTCA